MRVPSCTPSEGGTVAVARWSQPVFPILQSIRKENRVMESLVFGKKTYPTGTLEERRMDVNWKSKVQNVKKVREKNANPQVEGRLVFTTSYLNSQ